MKLIEENILDNGLVLQIFDLTRLIAADTAKVEVAFKMTMDLRADYFNNEADYLCVRDILGDILTYDYTAERTFVHEGEIDTARTELITTFKQNSLQYLSHAQFARKMALSLLRDINQNPYKYRKPPVADETV